MHKITFLFLLTLFLQSCSEDPPPSRYKYQNKLTLENIPIPQEILNCDCHTQGVGWCLKTNQLVITCQGDDDLGYLILFSEDETDAGLKAIHSIKNDGSGKKLSHPSAIQIHDGIFAVAISGGKRDSSFIYLYEVGERKIIPRNIPVLSYPKHIGALSLKKYEEKLILIGIGWDAKYFAIWESGVYNFDFKLIQEGLFAEASTGEVGAYNSLWAGKNASNDDILIASCGSFYSRNNNYLDIFRIKRTDTFFFEKAERIYVKGVTENTMKSLFYEGVTVDEMRKDTISIICAPQDFNKTNQGVFLENLYQGDLILQD